MAAADPTAFLRATPPFDALPEPLFARAAKAMEIAFHPAGTRLVRKGGERLRHLYVVRKGSVRLERDGQTLSVVEEGECFGYTSLLVGEATLDVVAEEDLLVYRVGEEDFRALLADATFAGHFASGLGDRLKSSLARVQVAPFPADLAVPLGELLRRAPIWIDEAATVADAAALMKEHRITSVLVRGAEPGIVTDRDFRNRVLAQGLGAGTPLSQVVTRPLHTVPASTPIYEAWTTLLDAGVHHLPVTRGADIVGVVSSSDLLRATAQGPLAVLRAVERLPSRTALPGYSRRVTEMVALLAGGGLAPTVIAGLVARLNDTLLRRILAWAEAELGPPPAPYAWLAFGSEGRMEQLLLTDQDNALVWADEGEPHRAWFTALAGRATADLQTAGFPPCPGGYMATGWLGPLAQWRRRFAGWIQTPDASALLEVAIFFDVRRVAGALDISPLLERIAATRTEPAFLRLLADAALSFRPPGPMRLRLRGDASRVDLKLQGVSPIVALARCYALESGTTARNTLERLDAAAAAGLVDGETRASMGEAFRYLLGVRLRAQLAAVAAGERPGNELSLGKLSGIDRSHLRDVFAAVSRWQEGAAHHYRLKTL